MFKKRYNRVTDDIGFDNFAKQKHKRELYYNHIIIVDGTNI